MPPRVLWPSKRTPFQRKRIKGSCIQQPRQSSRSGPLKQLSPSLARCGVRSRGGWHPLSKLVPVLRNAPAAGDRAASRVELEPPRRCAAAQARCTWEHVAVNDVTATIRASFAARGSPKHLIEPQFVTEPFNITWGLVRLLACCSHFQTVSKWWCVVLVNYLPIFACPRF